MSEPDDLSSQASAVGGADGPSPGERLAEARRAQSLSAADVARQLKLSVWQVEALEAGHYRQLPGAIFVRGFVRNYARLVKLDPDELLHAAGRSLPQAAPGPESPPSKEIPFPGDARPRWRAYAIAVAGVVAFLGLYEFYWNDGESTVVRPGTVAPQGEASRAAAAWTQSSGPRGSAPGAATAPPEPQQGIAVAATAHRALDARQTDVSGVEADLVPKPGERVIRLVFEAESWVEIRDRSGEAIFTKLNRPGTIQAIAGTPPLTVVVGNSQGVRMTYDDRPVDLARHTRIDVARLTLP